MKITDIFNYYTYPHDHKRHPYTWRKAYVGAQITMEIRATYIVAHLYIFRCTREYRRPQRTSSQRRYFIRNFLQLTSITHANLQRFCFVAESSKVRLTRGNVLLMHRWDVIIINDVTLVASATLDTRLGCKAGYKTTSVLRMQSEAKWVVNKRYSRLCSSHCSSCWCSPE